MSRSNPQATKGRHPHASGHGVTYITGLDGRLRSAYVCPYHGEEFETRLMLAAHVKSYKHRIRTEFAAMVRDGQLGRDTKAWEQLPGETPLAYARFKTYLTIRSRTKVAAVHNVPQRGINNLSHIWSWAVRADLFDQEVNRQEIQEFMETKKRAARDQQRIGRKLQQVAMAAANKLLENEERLDEMSGNEIAKLVDVGVKVERLANSDPTAITEDRSVSIVWEGPAPAWAPASPLKQSGAATIDAPTPKELPDATV